LGILNKRGWDNVDTEGFYRRVAALFNSSITPASKQASWNNYHPKLSNVGADGYHPIPMKPGFPFCFAEPTRKNGKSFWNDN
jgi:hypothetical protein